MEQNYKKYNEQVGKSIENKTIVKEAQKPEFKERPVREERIRKGIVIKCDKLRVRRKPSTSSDVLLLLDRESPVEIIGEDRNFYKINIPEKEEAYCMKKFIKVK